MPTTIRTGGRAAVVVSMLLAAGACSQLGGLGSVLGGGMGQPQTGQISGTVQTVDTRSQQLVLQQTNGQQIALLFDQQTQVTYQNRSYAVTNLERGDQVTARIQQSNNGGYYTDLVQVDQSVSSNSGVPARVGGGSGNGEQVQAFQGTVRQVDRSNGWFTIDLGNYTTVTVALPYNPSRNDQNRFQSLRTGEVVRLYGVYLNNSRVELRSFY